MKPTTLLTELNENLLNGVLPFTQEDDTTSHNKTHSAFSVSDAILSTGDGLGGSQSDIATSSAVIALQDEDSGQPETTLGSGALSFNVADVQSSYAAISFDDSNAFSAASPQSSAPESVPHASPFTMRGDVIPLDVESFGKGGGGGGGKGGSGGGGGSDPGVLTQYTSGLAGGFNVSINFKGTWTADLQNAFIKAADFLSSTILSDISDAFYRGKVIDDILIDASLQQIDGTGGVLGQAGATSIRTDSYLPATATMQFDTADASTFNSLGLWGDIVMHEMIHCIGFSSNIWGYMNLISGAGTSSPLFTGANATAAYESLFNVLAAAGVPLEQDGGAGTADSHWDEETFTNELMTGYINLGGNYLSGMTIAALEDMGYDTTWG